MSVGALTTQASPRRARQSAAGCCLGRLALSPGQLELGQSPELLRRLADLEAAHQETNVRKPRAGLAVSVFVMAAGTALVVGGGFMRSDFNLNSEQTRSERDIRVGRALIATGSITIAGGVAGLIFSAVHLRRAKRERQRLGHEITHLCSRCLRTEGHGGTRCGGSAACE